MIRNLIFDMGGVLMDFHPLAACRIVASNETDAQTLNKALFQHPLWGNLDDDSISPDALARLARDTLDEERLKPLVTAVFSAMPGNILTPIQGMEPIVRRAMSDGYQIYLLSNAGRKISEHREIIPLIGRFHGVVFSVEEKTKKPGAEIYTRLTTRYNLRPEECYFIDDDPGNVLAAQRLGWQGYRFTGDVIALARALKKLPRVL